MKRKLSLLLSLLLILSIFFSGCAEITKVVTNAVLEELLSSTDPTVSETSGIVQTPPAQTAPPVDDIVLPTQESTPGEETLPPEAESDTVIESGEYTGKDDVAAYIHAFGHLPGNFITKKEAEALGWVNSEGNLGKVAPGKSIGGDYFGNYEGLLPRKQGRKYYECDIDFGGKFRNGKRIIFSNDGLIYYTKDHYESFTQLY